MNVGVAHIVVSKKDILDGNMDSTLQALLSLRSSAEAASLWRERVDISFDGYSNTSLELWEVSEVRNFVAELDQAFPYWLYFMSKAHFGLQCVMLCRLPPFLTEEGKKKHFPVKIGELLERRWFPAMNEMCAFTKMEDAEVEAMTNRVLEYICAD